MEPFKYQIFICDQRKPEGVPACSARGSAAVIKALQWEVAAQGLADEVQITICGSLGLCERGPNMVVYPDGIWYSGLTPEIIPEIVNEHLKSGRPVARLVNSDAKALRNEIVSNRVKFIAGMQAREDAGVIPDDLMQTIQAFRPSRIILTAIELDIFSAIGNGATFEEVASKLALDARAAEMLLNALTSLELLEKKNGVFLNGSTASRFLAEGGRDDSRASLMHTANLWERWSTLTSCVRRGISVTYQEQAERPSQYTEAFIAAMHKNALFRAPTVIKALNLEKIKRVLDVGGGSGAYSMAFVRANSGIWADVFDLPNVVPIARRYISEAGLSDHIDTRTGDMRTDELGNGYDLALLSAICHMNSPEENKNLLAKCYRALNSDGQIVIQDFIMNSDKTVPQSGALFAINMLVGTKGGSTYSEAEYARWLTEAGFSDVRKVPLPGPTALMVGVRPK